MLTLPRRVPWASSDEFHHVYTALFGSEDADAAASQWAAIARIHTWQSRQSCPYAAEATASLLSVILQDQMQSQPQNGRPSAPLPLRLAYSMALIRFVNGLVDPEQGGPYARSIAAIAAQIGLPLWFVELRHAATHEDLPALSVLRDAARKGVDWLYARYWVPQRHALVAAQEKHDMEDAHADAAVTDGIGAEALSELADLLAAYKAHQKQALRDLSLPTEREFARLARAIERWVTAATSGAGQVGAGAPGRHTTDQARRDDQSASERAGCGALVQLLCETGGLVPVSRKKRAPSSKAGLPQLPAELLALWDPLLEHLDDTLDSFTSALLWHALDVLASACPSVSAITNADAPAWRAVPGNLANSGDKSYLATLAAWVVHLAQTEESDVQEEILRFCLVHGVGGNGNGSASLLAVRTALLAGLPHLSAGVTRLEQTYRTEPALVAPLCDEAVEPALASMEERLAQLEQRRRQMDNPAAHDARANGQAGSHRQLDIAEMSTAPDSLGAGWRLLDETSWTPCPLGMLPGGQIPILEVR